MLVTAGLFLGTASGNQNGYADVHVYCIVLKNFLQHVQAKRQEMGCVSISVLCLYGYFFQRTLWFVNTASCEHQLPYLSKKITNYKILLGLENLAHLLIILCAVWFFGVYFESGPEYLNNLLFHQTVNRGINTFHHKEPFYYYMVSFWYSLAPWSLLIFGVLLLSVVKRHIKTDLERFFLTTIVVIFVMLSLVSSKIQIYLAPAFPFMIYLTALLLQKFKWNRWLAITVALPAFLFSISIFVLLYFIFAEENQVLEPTIYRTRCCST